MFCFFPTHPFGPGLQPIKRVFFLVKIYCIQQCSQLFVVVCHQSFIVQKKIHFEMDFGHIFTLSNHYQSQINTNGKDPVAPLSFVSRLQREKQIGETIRERGGGRHERNWPNFDGAAQACNTRAWALNPRLLRIGQTTVTQTPQMIMTDDRKKGGLAVNSKSTCTGRFNPWLPSGRATITVGGPHWVSAVYGVQPTHRNRTLSE